MELPEFHEGKEQTEAKEEKREGFSLSTRLAHLKFWKKDGNTQNNNNNNGTHPQEANEEETPTYEEYVKRVQETEFSPEEKRDFAKFLYKGGSDMANRPIVLVVGSALPSKIDPDRLLLYIISIMDSFVERDYTIVYIHTNASAENRPSFAFLRKAYRILSRKYKKNLKALYIVHPTFWIKTTFKFFKPFISSKFWQKLTYVNEINEIYRFISRDSITLPQFVFDYQATKKVDAIFGVPLEEILARSDHADTLDIPIVVHKCIQYLREKRANEIQGIFRLSGGAATVQQLRKDFDKGEDVSLNTIEDPHIVAGLLKLFLRELPEPVFPFDHYHELIEAYKSKEKQIESFKAIFSKFPPANKALLKNILELIEFIIEKADINKMNSSNLSIVFAPNLIRPPPKEAAQLTVIHTPIINSIMRSVIDNTQDLIPSLSYDKEN